MDSEISKILDLFIAQERRFGSLKRYLWENRFEKWSLILAFISLLLSSFIWLFNPSYSLIGFGVCLTLFVVYLFAGTISSISFIANAKRDVLLSIKNGSEQDRKLASELAIHKVEALKHVQTLFLKRIKFIKNRAGFLVGAIDKLGLFPALFMLYYTFTQLPDTDSVSYLNLWLAAFTCGLYLGVVLLKSVIDSLQNSIDLLELAIEEASEYKLP